MFFLIRKAILASFLAILVVGGFYLYQNRAIFDPLVSAYRSWREGPEDKGRFVAQVTGQVTQVIDGATVQLKEPTGTLFNIRLAAVRVPNPADPANKNQQRLGVLSKTWLENLVLSQEIKIDATMIRSDVRVAFGVAYLGETNVNVQLIGNGQGWLDAGGLPPLPKKMQDELKKAETAAKEKRLGIWR